MRKDKPCSVWTRYGLPAGEDFQIFSFTNKLTRNTSFCKFNAEQAHTLIHWKWHLNDWVVSHLEDERECTPAKLAERDRMNSRKRQKYANQIVDRWQAEGYIKTLYKDFKTQKDTARELQAQKRGGWK
jgi:hypothetical protein